MLTKALVHIDVDGADLDGMLELPHDPLGVVLFAHGSGSSRLSPRNSYVARVLREARIGALLIDLLTVEEDRFYDTRFDNALLTRRLFRAATYLYEQAATAPLPLGLFGASTGAAAALQAAADPRLKVAAVVARGGRPDLAGPAALHAIDAPTLLIVGGNDHDVLRLNRNAFAELHCPKDFAVIAGASHLFEEPGALEAVARLASDWFAGHFLRN